mgnify:CR=1 FL=1
MDKPIRLMFFSISLFFIIMGVIATCIFFPNLLQREKSLTSIKTDQGNEPLWLPPDSSLILQDKNKELIAYGKELVVHTSSYLGPQGKIRQISNGMNCQNCHLKAGTKIFGNNYSAVAANYPKFRDRSGSVESIESRVNDCIERSLNGKKLNNSSREMRAFVSYINWVGQGVPKNFKPRGTGLWELKPISRAADPLKGKLIFTNICQRCHGMQGEGLRENDKAEWKYPPLWGENSFNTGAGLYRLSRFAGYVKTNMPYGIATFNKPVLTDEEAWDVAAYVNTMPRPTKDFSNDWPNISHKPFDYPFGPYTDGFNEIQHKYGPYILILEKKKKLNL